MKNDETTRILYGDRLVTTEDIKTKGAVDWAAPYTGGFDCIIPKGTILVPLSDQREGTLAFNCVPEKYEEFEKLFVPASDRFALKYSGYHFSFSNLDIGGRLQLISRASASKRKKYEFKTKISDLFRDNMVLQVLMIIFLYAFIIITLPFKPFVNMFRSRRLAAKRKAEEGGA